jgi:hypothetical protein
MLNKQLEQDLKSLLKKYLDCWGYDRKNGIYPIENKDIEFIDLLRDIGNLSRFYYPEYKYKNNIDFKPELLQIINKLASQLWKEKLI